LLASWFIYSREKYFIQIQSFMITWSCWFGDCFFLEVATGGMLLTYWAEWQLQFCPPAQWKIEIKRH